MLKDNKMQKVSSKYPNDIGKNTFHPNPISWSYRYLGKAALIQIKSITKKHTFIPNQTAPGIKFKKLNGGNHPPKNNITFNELINSIFAYSPNEKSANPIAEYSTLYPETNSASASGRSNGCLFVSASAETKNIKKRGKKGIKNHTFFCDSIITCKLKEPQHTTTVTIINPIETSYDTIWAADRNAPRNAYFELLDHPDIIIPYTPSEDTANKYNTPTFNTDNKEYLS